MSDDAWAEAFSKINNAVEFAISEGGMTIDEIHDLVDDANPDNDEIPNTTGRKKKPKK